jgi:hypothetical protein
MGVSVTVDMKSVERFLFPPVFTHQAGSAG